MTKQDNATTRVLAQSFGRVLTNEEIQAISGARWVGTNPHPTIHNDNGPIEIEPDYDGREWI